MRIELYATKTQSHVVAVALLELQESRSSRTRVKRATVTPNSLTKEKRSMKALVARFVREESGQDLIEYGLLIGIITAAAITAIQAIGPKVGNYYSNLNSRLP
jgi:pilus assembly protein Flp/PilA